MLILTFGSGGSGKTTLKDNIIKNDNSFCTIVSTTTRPIRPGEVHGKDYYYVSKEEFDKKNYLIGFNNNTDFYGIEDKEFLKHKGIVAIDLSMAEKAKELFFGRDMKIIYINPTEECLKARMIGRGDSQERAKDRFERDVELKKKFDVTSFGCPYLLLTDENEEEALEKALNFLNDK